MPLGLFLFRCCGTACDHINFNLGLAEMSHLFPINCATGLMQGKVFNSTTCLLKGGTFIGLNAFNSLMYFKRGFICTNASQLLFWSSY